MRINVYHEEIGEGYSVIEQVTRNGERFFGLRIWLRTCQELLDHSTDEDDDRSAITFWAPNMAQLNQLVSELKWVLKKSPYIDPPII